MFNDIGNTIGTAAKILFILSIIVGCFWTLISLNSSGSIIIPIIVGIGGCISSILMYGLSVIIDRIIRIDEKIETILKGNDATHASINE